MKRIHLNITGWSIVILGIAMFFLGASLFSYQGPTLNPIVNKAGEYSFLFWLPTIIVGVLILTVGRKIVK